MLFLSSFLSLFFIIFLSFLGDSTALSKFVHCVEMDDENNLNIGNSSNNGINGNNGNNGNDASNSTKNKVVVEWGPSGISGSSSLDVLLRYRCGAFPGVGSFYLLIYDDPYQSQLYEMWHVIVQSRQKIDIHSSLGSSTSVDLIVRGDRYAR